MDRLAACVDVAVVKYIKRRGNCCDAKFETVK